MAQEPNPYEIGRADVATTREEFLLGRALVRVAGAIFLVSSAYVILMFNLLQGQERLPAQLIRFALTAVGVYYLARGSSTIRWLAVVGGTLVALEFWANLRSVWFIPVAVGYTAAVLLLLLPRSVRRFFAQGRS